MVALVFWIACTRSGSTCCHLSLLWGLQNAWETSCSNENEIMNGNQGDRVNFVWKRRRGKQRLSLCRTFHPFIQHHDTDAIHRCTLRSRPDVTLPTHAGWYEFPVAGQLCVQNVTHACLLEKNVQPMSIHLKPHQPRGKPFRSGSAVLLDKNNPVYFSILQK